MRSLPVVIAALAFGCVTQRTVGQPSLDVKSDNVAIRRHDKVDMLFMIDDSLSMASKQAALRASFPQLLTRIEQLATQGLPASFHIGVVDSDLGAGRATAVCAPDGDGGRMRTTARPSVLGPPPAACADLQLTDGASFITFDSAGGATNVAGVDVATAFSCIASVGDEGCGFEHQLESVYRALTRPELNPGFLRDDALLVVVWLTDEDDCSAPPDSDLFDPSPDGIVMYGPLQSFRCSQFGLTCDGKPLAADGRPTACVPTVGGPLFDVKRYADLFTLRRGAGGIKDSPNDVLLVSLAAPPTPVIAQSGMLTPSCASPVDEAFSGDPAVRLHAVIDATRIGVEDSICSSDYTSTIDAIVEKLASKLAGGCLPGGLLDTDDPQCVVTLGGTVLTRCGDGHLPCWALVFDPACQPQPSPGGTSQQYRIEIEGARSTTAAISATCPLYEPAS